MAGCFAIELAKAADIVKRDRGLAQRFIVGIYRLGAAQMERRPEQHGRMAVRQYETIAIGPDRILRIETEDAISDRIDKRRQGQRSARVACLCLRDRSEEVCANGIDTQLIELCGR